MREYNFEEFKQEIIMEMKRRLQGCEIWEEIIRKNNGVELIALVIYMPAQGISPCFYLKDYYQCYLEGGASIESICNDIEKICYDCMKENHENDLQYETASGRIEGRLVNTKRNAKMMETVPHRNILDLSLIYLIEVEVNGDQGAVLIDNTLLERWGVDEKELYFHFKKNMEKKENGFMENMKEIVFYGMPGPWNDILKEEMPDIYVLSNQDLYHGAVQILNEKMIQKAEKILGSFFLLPSSVHEMLLIPSRENIPIYHLLCMVKDVNRTMLKEEEILSSSVYYYDAEKKELEVAAYGED